ncbi:MAG: prepilin-type N-terminal cleavage/methylation domain-containing protein [Enhygromyxa sp.]
MRVPNTRERRNQAGFTMAEVMVALIVFIVAVVGLVAMESRGIEAQRASMETREGERLAQEVMAELMATSFDELVEYDFGGGQNPSLPYDDVELQTWELRDYGAVPNATGERAPGTRRNFYWAGRKVDRWPINAIGVPDALQLEVTVLWIDYTNPSFPPPADVGVGDLIPGNLDPADPKYLPFVRGVQLRTVRVNDARNPL